VQTAAVQGVEPERSQRPDYSGTDGKIRPRSDGNGACFGPCKRRKARRYPGCRPCPRRLQNRRHRSGGRPYLLRQGQQLRPS
jgi:hypothetical protein